MKFRHKINSYFILFTGLVFFSVSYGKGYKPAREIRNIGGVINSVASVNKSSGDYKIVYSKGSFQGMSVEHMYYGYGNIYNGSFSETEIGSYYTDGKNNTLYTAHILANGDVAVYYEKETGSDDTEYISVYDAKTLVEKSKVYVRTNYNDGDWSIYSAKFIDDNTLLIPADKGKIAVVRNYSTPTSCNIFECKVINPDVVGYYYSDVSELERSIQTNSIYFYVNNESLYKVPLQDLLNNNSYKGVKLYNEPVENSYASLKYFSPKNDGGIFILGKNSLINMDRFDNIVNSKTYNEILKQGFSSEMRYNHRFIPINNDKHLLMFSDRQNMMYTIVNNNGDILHKDILDFNGMYDPYINTGKSYTVLDNGKLVAFHSYGDFSWKGLRVLVFDNVPPKLTGSIEHVNIGDNTPVTINVSSEEPVPKLGVYNKATNECYYLGNFSNSLNLNLDLVGSNTLVVKSFDEHDTVLSEMELSYNKLDMLNRIISLADKHSNLINYMIVDGTDRYFENNIQNQKLVQDIKTISMGSYIIYDNPSDVLTPILE